MSIVMKYAGEFMDLGDKSQYMDEYLRRVQSVVNIAALEFELGGKLRFFSRPMPDDISAKDLYTKLSELLDAIYRIKSELKGDYLTVAAAIGFMSRLQSLQDSVEDAKTHVRLEIAH